MPYKRTGNPTGRPCEYERDLADRVLGHMIDGWSCTASCRLEDIAAGTFRQWAFDDVDGLHARYASAQKYLIEACGDKVMDRSAGIHRMVARAERDGFVEATDIVNGVSVTKQDTMVAVARDRLETDALRWTLAKIAPKKYGDKYIVPPSDIPMKAPYTDEEVEAAQKKFE